MIKNNRYILALAACVASGALLSGCATNGAGSIPNTTQANLNSNVLQLAVGTATIAEDNTVGLNVVATLRQPNGLSGVLADQPSISGPFTVPAGAPGAYPGSANLDAGTGQITASPQVPRNNAGLINTTFGTFNGVFSYGFGPYNCDQNCTNIGAYYPGNPNGTTGNGFFYSNYACASVQCNTSNESGDTVLTQPFYAASFGYEYVVGPPAVPFFQNGTFPSGFAGYSPGFTTFELTPGTGQYNLNVLVAAQNAPQKTYSATATLNSTAPLGTTTVTATEDGVGGLTGTVSVPAGVTETEVYITDVTAGGSQNFYMVGPLSGTGTVNWTLPSNLGPCAGSNCQNGAGASPSITPPSGGNPGDTYFVAAVGTDYPAFEAGPPGNTQQRPTITGANGQADITMSTYMKGQYGSGGGIQSAHRSKITAKRIIH